MPILRAAAMRSAPGDSRRVLRAAALGVRREQLRPARWVLTTMKMRSTAARQADD